MKQADRSRLTQALREHVGRIAADLKRKLERPGPAQERARALHADEQVGEDFLVWVDLLARRAAVLWVLKSVYVRVLEDRGLLAPGRLLDRGAQELFDRLAPRLGPTAFLRWVYHDLSSKEGGLPELFAPQPAEVVEPDNEASQALIDFWRQKDPDSGFCWSFADERFEGELMGDLYQELDPVVKQRYALCQTPDFVRAFILDRTLTPALAEYGADKVRLLDPACGSGHFLIDGLKRMLAALPEETDKAARRAQVQGVLARVVGVDLNDYACALARARLLMTAAELAGDKTLEAASAYHPQVYWADGLEQVEKDEARPQQQLSLLGPPVDEPTRASLTRPEVRAALRPVLAGQFEAVVANPPYITEKDPARKTYHREKVGKRQRYVSASMQYSLGAPFTERCFQLARDGGYVGLITSNNFMKREFGAPLIEQVLAGKDLTLVVDTSQAYIPFHGTPTVLLFGRQQAPVGDAVPVVMGKRGETGTPEKPAEGKVWQSIAVGWNQVGFETDYVSVVNVPREKLSQHPWSLGGGGVAELKAKLEYSAQPLSQFVETPIGRTVRIGADDIFVAHPRDFHRRGFSKEHVKPIVVGEQVRDWTMGTLDCAFYPYQPNIGSPVDANDVSWVEDIKRLSPWKQLLSRRATFQGVMKDAGLPWYVFMQHTPSAYRAPLSLIFAFVATHNQFLLDRGGKVFKQTAPVIKLPAGSTEEDHLALLGLLNSSTACFWLKQVCSAKGGESTGKLRQSEAWSRRIEHDGTKLQSFPIVTAQRERIIALARQLDQQAQQMAKLQPQAVLAADWQPANLRTRLREAEAAAQALRDQMVAWQEELDWTAYVAYGLVGADELLPLADIEPLGSADRPFAVALARAVAAGAATTFWFEAMQVSPHTDIPQSYSAATRVRLLRRLALIAENPELALLETPEYKRKWEPLTFQADLLQAAAEWLAQRLEDAARERGKPFTLDGLTAAVQDDLRLLAVASIVQGREAVDLRVLVAQILDAESVPSHPFHIYTESGLKKREAWEEVWRLQREEDSGSAQRSGAPSIDPPPEYSQGSRGKPTDFQKNEYWKLRGALDVPKERFIAFTEVPGERRYGWAGWTPVQRIKALLTMDEDLEDAGVALSERVALLDSAWRLLPTVEQEDPASAKRLRGELQAALGTPEGPSPVLLAAWKQAHPTPDEKKPKKPTARKAKTAETAKTPAEPKVQ